MQVNSAVNSAMFGYQKATESLDNTAQNLAVAASNNSMPADKTPSTTALQAPSIETNPRAKNIDINTEQLNLNSALYNGMASLKVLDTADEVMGTTIDVSV